MFGALERSESERVLAQRLNSYCGVVEGAVQAAGFFCWDPGCDLTAIRRLWAAACALAVVAALAGGARLEGGEERAKQEDAPVGWAGLRAFGRRAARGRDFWGFAVAFVLLETHAGVLAQAGPSAADRLLWRWAPAERAALLAALPAAGGLVERFDIEPFPDFSAK